VLPLIFLAVPMVTALVIPKNASQHLIDQLLGQTQLFLLLIALVLPSTVSAYAVIGEREQGTLEPVLTTPATDTELLLGKAIAAVAPAVGLAWLLYVVFLVVVRIGAIPAVVEHVWRADQFVGELLLVPALAVLTIILGMMISARTTDMRVAQQLSGLVVLPMAIGYVFLSLGTIRPSVLLFVGLALVTALAGWSLLSAHLRGGNPRDMVGSLALLAGSYLLGRLTARWSSVVAALSIAGFGAWIALTPGAFSGGPLAGPLGYANANAALAVEVAAIAVIAAARSRLTAAKAVLAAAALTLLTVAWVNQSWAALLPGLALVVVAMAVVWSLATIASISAGDHKKNLPSTPSESASSAE
jgi:ABC-2 type transport system permease protein